MIDSHAHIYLDDFKGDLFKQLENQVFFILTMLMTESPRMINIMRSTMMMMMTMRMTRRMRMRIIAVMMTMTMTMTVMIRVMMRMMMQLV